MLRTHGGVAALLRPGPAALLAACVLATTRPPHQPLPEASTVELELTVPDATRRVAEALRAADVPVVRVEPRDGWLETPWFEAASGKPTSATPVGSAIVRVRGWVDVGRPEHSDVTVETVFHRVVDPSASDRSLDRIAGPDNPAVKRVQGVLDSLRRRYGEPPPPPPPPRPAPEPEPADSTARDSVQFAPDTTRDSLRTPASRDTARVKPRTL
ncbi:MAG TPA: hypothetical protein VFK09_03485 [Gemmatimonadales bacterium]|nr:hypothetical protein [Gemmatimonadales bacterium]